MQVNQLVTSMSWLKSQGKLPSQVEVNRAITLRSRKQLPKNLVKTTLGRGLQKEVELQAFGKATRAITDDSTPSGKIDSDKPI